MAFLDAQEQRRTVEFAPADPEDRGEWREMIARLPVEVDYPASLQSIYVYSKRRRRGFRGRLMIDNVAVRRPPMDFFPDLCGPRGPCACPAD